MSRLFDHLVFAVGDLAAAHSAYQALGFTLTPRAVHPFGTCNHLVQFAANNFLELVAVGDDSAIPPHVPPKHFSFGAHNRQFVREHGQGFSMLCMRSADARGDVAEFQAKGLTTYEAFDFGRDARLPDGSVARVGFSLAFVTQASLPSAAFFTCQHRHPPELFWKADYHSHPNGALGVVEVIVSVDLPHAQQAFFENFLANVAEIDEQAIHLEAAGEQLTLLTPTALLHRFPELADGMTPDVPLKAYRIAVGDLAVTRTCLERNQVPFRVTPGSLVVPARAAQGVVLEFSETWMKPC